ncbi:MAG: prepilin-type N-terminal cleavage/methylation domain-containing protein [Candidatus Omnitrophica bacterium]|nr:prepilin-type N-terminal cleavage/methylation domain-containing protein [Candidatus Omnitrophota bacterium]
MSLSNKDTWEHKDTRTQGHKDTSVVVSWCPGVPTKAVLYKGFTLVEILISLAILAMIVTSTFTIFRSASKSWQKGETRSERYQNARSAISRISSETSQAVINSSPLCKFTGDKNKVSFVSFVSTGPGVFELSEVEYWLDGAKRLLMRNDEIDPDYDFTTYGHSDILSENISELEFSYFDGLIWLDTWNSDQASGVGLPKAVKIKIRVEDKKAKEGEIFEVIARLRTA